MNSTGDSAHHSLAYFGAIAGSAEKPQNNEKHATGKKKAQAVCAPNASGAGKQKSVLVKNLLSRGDRSAQTFAPIELKSKNAPPSQ